MASDTVVQPDRATHSPESRIGPGAKIQDPFTLVIFGATGDLAARKLLPALFGLWHASFLPEQFAIVGVGRREKSNDVYRGEVKKNLATFRPDSTQTSNKVDDFLPHLGYHAADITKPAGMQSLADGLRRLQAERKLPGNYLFYLATDPEFFGPAVESLARSGLIEKSADASSPWTRVVIEKPFGRDLASAQKLDQHVLQFLRHDQLYRIDHYLGKETVQNLMAFRFGNAIFEPLFNRQYVDHVQITVAETVGMEGKRGAFYDHAGALRDVVQNHMLQLLALVAMDAPTTLKASDVGDAKLKVLRNLVPLHGAAIARSVVRGQYGPGTIGGKAVPGYRQEEAIAPNSNTETYVALRTEVESWRWAGVPFLLRTGKCLPRRTTEIAVQFKLPPMRLFRTVECEGDVCDLTSAKPTVIAFRIQPNEGISISFSAKRPGMQLDLHPVRFEFDYDHAFHQSLPEAYERLLFDSLRGDPTLFMHSDELRAAWEFVNPILEAWQEPAPEFPNYAAGSWGPASADTLAAGCAGGWRQP
jgi:glucose-6-phosphate 1-dehydrogenase